MAAILLDAVSATGAGGRVRMNRSPHAHTIQATMGGTVVATAVTLDIEASLDEVTWFQLVRHVFTAADITAEGVMFHLADMPVTYLRVNLIALTGGTAPTLTVKHVWSEM